MNLDGQTVFLAASYPNRQYKDRADTHEIAIAVKAFAGAIFHVGGKLVFGGHPSISPLVLMIAREYSHRGQVTIYQSDFYKDHLSDATRQLEVEGFGKIVFTPRDGNENAPDFYGTIDSNRASLSLLRMRQLMLEDSNPLAMILIGGDTGLKQELELFNTKCPGRPVIPVWAPGGITREFLPQLPNAAAKLLSGLRESDNYISLAGQVVEYLIDYLGRGPRRFTAAR